MAKVKNKRNAGLADKVHKKKKAEGFKKKMNPFEVHINKEKLKVLGKKSKHDRGLPGVSRGKAVQKRKETLGTEMKLMHKTNAFIDKRIGEKSGNLSAEDRMIARFAAERAKQHSKKSIYNLADDEILTHRGQTLEQIEKFDDPRSSDEEDDDGKKFGGLDDDFVSEGHFGGGILSKTESKDGAKSHKDLIEQLIAESKKRKAEKQKEKEHTLDLTEKLDSEWKDLQPVVFKRARLEEKEKESMIDKLLSKAEAKNQDYDKMMRELKFEKRGTPSDGLKSAEKQAKEEKERLDKLEKEREQRMMGDDEVLPSRVVPAATKHRSADDLDDNFDFEDDPQFMLAYDKNGKPLVPEKILKDYSVPNTKPKFDDGVSDTSSDDDDDEEESGEDAESKKGVDDEKEQETNDTSDGESEDDETKVKNNEKSKSNKSYKEIVQKIAKSDTNPINENINKTKKEKDKQDKKKNDNGQSSILFPDEKTDESDDDSDFGSNKSVNGDVDDNLKDLEKDTSGESDTESEDNKTKVKNKEKSKLNVSNKEIVETVAKSEPNTKIDESRSKNSNVKDKQDKKKNVNESSSILFADEESNEDSDNDNESESDDESDFGSNKSVDGDPEDHLKDLRDSEEESYDEENAEEDTQKIKSFFELKATGNNLKELLSGKSPSQQSAALQKLIKSYDPGLAHNNKELLATLFAHLLQYTNDLFTNLTEEGEVIKAFLVFDKLVPHFFDLAQTNKVSSKKFFVELLKEKREIFLKSPKKAPGLDTLIFFKLISLLYPTSDFRHPVTTPSLIFMTEILSLTRFRSPYAISAGLFLTSLVLEYTALSKRLVPAAINFLRGILYLCANTSILNPIQLVPPFRLQNDKILNLEDDCSEMVVDHKMAAKDLVLNEVNNDYKIRCLDTCIGMLREYFDYFVELEAQQCLFEPHIALIGRIDLDLYPNKIASKITETVKYMKESLEMKTFVPLTSEKKRPKALRMYEPDVQEVFTGSKSSKLPREMAERAKLQGKYKKEMKGALREIRRDKAYIASVKIRQKIHSDNVRKEKVKQIYKDASIQQGELNKLKRMK